MATLKIADILATSPIDPERHLDPERVEQYERSLDHLAPAVVFANEEGYLLADGYHRVATARKGGRGTIEAEVRTGSRMTPLNMPWLSERHNGVYRWMKPGNAS